MPASGKDIQRRLKSVHSIKKITRAMELVSASKMRKSVNRVLASRAYAESAWQLVMDLMPKAEPQLHALLQERPAKRVAVMVISSNRGLCGAFNINTAQKAVALVKKEKWDAGVDVDFITFGKKSAQVLASMEKNITADYQKDDITDEVEDVSPLVEEAIKGFISKKYDEVAVVYTHYFSSIKQETRVRHLLPLVRPSRYLGKTEVNNTDGEKKDFSEFIFEPSPDAVLKSLLPRLIELQMYQAVLETEASEHSARMMAMHNASDAATDMIDTLTLAYNQARQASITAELAEISGAAVALQ